MSTHPHTQVINDLRTVKCYQVRDRHMPFPNGLAPGEVDHKTLYRDIERGWQYFKNNRPQIHFSTFDFEYKSHRRASA